MAVLKAMGPLAEASKACGTRMPTPSLGGREPTGFSHKAREGHRESAFVPRDPETSSSALNSDVGYLGRAGSFYTAWCQMHELFTPMTSEVSTVWDVEFFHPPPPPPPPPRHRRFSFWDVAATVPQERPENSELHWTNPYGPDPPAEVAPPAAEPVIEVAFHKATKASESSSSCREEGFMPDSSFADDDVSNPCSSIPPVQEPAFAALANLQVCAEMPGAPASFTLSEYYSMQGPLSPCSPAPTESYGGREPRFSQATTVYKYGQALSPASTQVGAPLPEHGGQGLAGGFSPKFPPGAPAPSLTICFVSTMTVHLGCRLRMTTLPIGIGLTSLRTEMTSASIALSSAQINGADYLAAVARKCSRAVCVNCLEKMSGQTFRCSCGDERKLESTLWMIGAYNSVMNGFAFLTGAKPAGAFQGYTAMPWQSHAHSVPSPLLELPPPPSTAVPQHRTLCPVTTKEMLPPAAPLPAPQSLPSLLGHRRRASQAESPSRERTFGQEELTGRISTENRHLFPEIGGLQFQLEVEVSGSNKGRFPVPIPHFAGEEISTSASDVGYLGRAGSFYTAWCQMHELFTPMTSEISTVWDAGFQFFQRRNSKPASHTEVFHRPPPPRRLCTLGSLCLCAARAARDWLRVALDQPLRAEVAPPAVEPVIEVAFHKATKMPTPSLSGREPPVHKVAGDPRTSATSDSDFYTAWCRMYSYELFTPMTSEVSSKVWDVEFFHPPPPPPPPPPRRRSAVLWDVAATVPQERPENGSELRWTNPYGPDPPAEVAPPAVEPVIEVARHKATKVSESSSSCREEGFMPDSTLADDVSDPCSSIPPLEEPAFAALANLRVCAEMPGAPESFTLSDYYSRQGPLSPCSPAPTECYGGREARFSQEQTEYDHGRQGLLSPAPTEHCFDRQAWSPASTQIGAGLAGGFSPKFLPGVPIKPDDLLHEHNDCPFGMPPPDDSTAHRNWPHFCQGPRKCSRAVCVNCLEKMSGRTFRCSCGDEGNIESTLWMIGAYHSVMSTFDFITGAKPAHVSEGYTAMPSRSQTHCVPNPLLEPPSTTNTAALPQHRTLCPATTKELLPPAAPLPAPQSLPSLLGHRRRVSQALVPLAAGTDSPDAELRGCGVSG
ncbi:unnamed protein product [Symbiodinium sp. CCMP2456]|nr:unnamed protein product [Symbiodinium sp. CCMP2456]